jgi:hypothetical protein
MDQLLEWLREQNRGVGTYISLQQRAHHLVQSNPDHAALFQLLGALAGRFVSSYDGMPLSVDVARSAFERVSLLVEKAARTMDNAAEEKLKILNEIARAELD